MRQREKEDVEAGPGLTLLIRVRRAYNRVRVVFGIVRISIIPDDVPALRSIQGVVLQFDYSASPCVCVYVWEGD